MVEVTKESYGTTYESAKERPGVPITIITGWLGSGKTTLVNHILKNEKGLRVAVIINEYGDVDIDGEVLARKKVADTTLVTLDNGCICCTISQDLVDNINSLLSKPECQDLDCIVIETSGVADVEPLIDTLNFTDLAFNTHLDAVITVVDVETFDSYHHHSPTALSQVRNADLLILNKIDLVTEEHVDNVKSIISRLMKNQKQIPSLCIVNGNVSLQLLLGLHKIEESHLTSQNKRLGHLHEDRLEYLTYVRESPFDMMKFESFVENSKLLEDVVRSKGFLWFKGIPQLVIFHLVGKRTNPFETIAATRPNKTSLVFIGRNLKKDKLQAALDCCLVSAPASLG